MRKIIVNKSGIDSMGIFADVDIKAGETIIEWKPTYLSFFEFNKLPEDEKRYVGKIDENTYRFMQSPERYMNHSCNPNSKAENNSDVALKFISKGAEITSDYGIGSEIIGFKCNCGSSNCRELI